MNNLLYKLSKFSFVFLAFMAAGLAFYIIFNRTAVQKKLSSFEDGKIRNTCQTYKVFLECYRAHLPGLSEESLPADFIYITNRNEKIRDRDLYYAKTDSKKEMVQFLYFENTGIIIDYMKNYGVDRRNLGFIQIISLPFLKSYFRRYFKNIKSELEKFENGHKDFLKDKSISERHKNLAKKIKNMQIR